MEQYFDFTQSAAYVYGDDPSTIIRLMGTRFMGANPETPYVWRTWDMTGIQSDQAAAYHFNFAERFPGGEAGETVRHVIGIQREAGGGADAFGRFVQADLLQGNTAVGLEIDRRFRHGSGYDRQQHRQRGENADNLLHVFTSKCCSLLRNCDCRNAIIADSISSYHGVVNRTMCKLSKNL